LHGIIKSKLKNKKQMNLNKLTKAELISKLQKQQHLEKLAKADLKNSKSETSNVIPTSNSKVKSESWFWSVFNKIKLWFISWAIIAFMIRLFRNYKNLRNILRIMNYVILSLFGISFLEMVGAPSLFQLKQYFYMTTQFLFEIADHFHMFLNRVFNIDDTLPSTRKVYKKPLDNDWKAELERADREKTMKEWMQRNNIKDEESWNYYKAIILCILTLGAAIAIWYYGRDALDLLTQGFSISGLIQSILRGGRDGNPPPADSASSVVSIQVDPPNNKIPPAPPAPDSLHVSKVAGTSNTEDIPRPSLTERGAPNLLDQIKVGKKLKKGGTMNKYNEQGQVIIDGDNEVSVKSSSIFNKLSDKLDKIRAATDDDDNTEDKWDDGASTPTNSVFGNTAMDIVNKDGSDSPRSDKAELGINYDNEKQKFLDSINVAKASSSKLKGKYKEEITEYEIPPVIKPILEHFPNLSSNTIEKLSVAEDEKGRQEILQIIPLEELTVKVSPSDITEINELIFKPDLSKEEAMKLSGKTMKIKTDDLIEILSGDDNRFFKDELIRFNINEKLSDTLLKNPDVSKQTLIHDFISRNPVHQDKILKIIKDDIENVIDDYEKDLNQENFKKVKSVLIQQDLKEIEELGENKSISQIKTLKHVNKSHSDLLQAIKSQGAGKKRIEVKSEFDNPKFHDEMNLFD
jgi:hypothetical protein